MPVYDFKCQECGKVTEFLLSGSSDNKKTGLPGLWQPESGKIVIGSKSATQCH